MQTAFTIALLLLALLLFVAVQACAHDAVFGDGAGGGLSRSLIVLAVPLFVAAAVGLLMLRQRAGHVAWPSRTVALVLGALAVGQFAAVKIILLGVPARPFAPLARAGLAGGEALLLLMAWRGPASGVAQMIGAALLAAVTLGPLAVLKPALDRHAEAKAAFRLEEQARIEAEKRPRER